MCICLYRQCKNHEDMDLNCIHLSIFHIFVLHEKISSKRCSRPQGALGTYTYARRSVRKIFRPSRYITLASLQPMAIISVYLHLKISHFGNVLVHKYRIYIPVCACAECSPWVFDKQIQKIEQNILQTEEETPLIPDWKIQIVTVSRDKR